MSTGQDRVESGAVSGHETQFVFSDGDVRASDTDLIRQPAPGEFVIPRSIKFL